MGSWRDALKMDLETNSAANNIALVDSEKKNTCWCCHLKIKEPFLFVLQTKNY